jgi:uracil-DNA glycosylase family 4
MAGEAEQQLRAYVDYLRDIGIHDFYRRGEPVPAGIRDTPPVAVEAAVVEDDGVVNEPDQAPASTRPAFLEPPIAKLVSFNDLAPLPESRVAPAHKAEALAAVREDIGDCTRCPLAYAGRRTIVFGDGSATARLMFVGEGPGADEDASGVPFVGKAGQLLNNMIQAMGLKREEVYIANVVKCRPPANRVPEPVEANTCDQFLLRQVDVVAPQVIVALGATAAMYLLGVKQSLSSLRGRWHSCRGAKLAVTYHPAFLLRDPAMKGEAWKDLQRVMAEMGLKPPAKR